MVTVDRGRYTLLFEGRTVTAMKSRPLGRKGVVVGDRVRVVGDVSGADGSLARIVEVNERTTTLRRTADDDDPVERVIVSNAEQLVVVTALADPEPRTGLIDRALVAAYDARMTPVLCLTKADLADPETLLATYRHLDVAHVVTQRGGDLDAVRAVLAGRPACWWATAASASPRWSTPWSPRRTARSASSTRSPAAGGTPRRRRTCCALPGDDGGWIIDTPGIRSFGLAHVDPDRLIGAFPDLEAETDVCPRGCTHGEGEPECGLDEAIADGHPGRRRGWSPSGGCSPPVRATRTDYRRRGGAPHRLAPASPVWMTITSETTAMITSSATSDHSTSGLCRPRANRPDTRPEGPPSPHAASPTSTAKTMVTQNSTVGPSWCSLTAESCSSSGRSSRKLLPEK